MDWYDNEDAGDLDMYLEAEYSAHKTEILLDSQWSEYHQLSELVDKGTHSFECEDCETNLTETTIAPENELAWLCIDCWNEREYW